MRLPESWLRAWVPNDLSIEEIADRLTMAGLEVEEIEARAPDFTGVVLAKVLAAEKHPDADRLRVCTVDAGPDAPSLQIICGAPNARAGIYVACARDGAVLPGHFKIKQAKMRGVVSQGMLCSGKELGMTEDSEGILELDLGQSALGSNIRDHLRLDEKTLVIKLTPNRADCLSMAGVARELSALIGKPLVKPAYVQNPSAAAAKGSASIGVTIDPAAHDLCGRFVSRVVTGVNAKAATPDWMKARLEQAGQRSISALVDISNYVMLELGQPNHIFDRNKLSGDLSVRWAKPGEQLALLNGQTVELAADVGVVADAKGPVSLAGIMGGDGCSVGDETTEVVLEAAFWWPDAIRGRANRYKFSTDAGHRFERGVDPAATADQLAVLTHLVVEICGGQAGPVLDQVVRLPQTQSVSMRQARCEKILGRPYSREQIESVFKGLGFEFQTKADPAAADKAIFTVTAPSYRFDLAIEEDLIEEVARIVGFDAIDHRPPVAPLVMAHQPEGQRTKSQLRNRMVGADYNEVVTYSFIDRALAEAFARADQLLPLQNPIAAQMAVMRPSLVPGLLTALTDNLARKESRVRVFEIGRKFIKDASVKAGPWSVQGVHQPVQLAALAYGDALGEQWATPARWVDFFDLKADLERLVSPLSLSFERPDAMPAAGAQGLLANLHPGRAALVLLAGQVIGAMGELHPKLCQTLELAKAPVVFEIDLDAVLPRPIAQPSALSKFPAVTRDLAFVMPEQTAAGQVIAKVQEAARKAPNGQRLQRVVVFDEYRGTGLSEGEKSLAFRFVLQDTEKTLEDSEVDALMSVFSDTVQSVFSARVRR